MSLTKFLYQSTHATTAIWESSLKPFCTSVFQWRHIQGCFRCLVSKLRRCFPRITLIASSCDCPPNTSDQSSHHPSKSYWPVQRLNNWRSDPNETTNMSNTRPEPQIVAIMYLLMTFSRISTWVPLAPPEPIMAVTLNCSQRLLCTVMRTQLMCS